ncbi:MAG TPA: carboxypeptidase-like regulatory domain-containing protein [Kofleriaceae bacterium]|nr:carboxypeptidase-like regulatory domain-containing protein [Kofleriaceae bacterium]
MVGLGLVGETPWAAPQVEIKAQTRLALDKVKLRADGEVEVSGQLLDKLTNDGIGSQQVVIRLGGTVQHAITEPDGRFRASFAVPPGPQPVDLRFPGGNLLDGSHLTIVTDPSRAQVTLQLRAEDTDAGARLFIIAAVEDTPTTLDVQLAAGGADDADLKPLATARSDQPYLLSRTALGGPGSKRVRATFPGDQTRQQATAEITLDLATGTKTSLEAKHTTVAYEDDVEMFGKVVDDDGKPVARASVALSSGDRRLAQGATNEDGSYKFSVEAEIVGQGQFGLQVAAEPASTYVRASRSNPVIIKIAAPQPVPVSYTVAAFLATALAAGGFFTARAKPWRKLRKAAPASELATGATDAEQDGGGLVANKPGIVSTLRRPYDDGFSGVVRDTVRGRPVADATIRITLDDQVIELVTAEDGSFAVDKLALGEWRAEVTAPGHVTERFAVSIPHRGELRGVRVDLVPVRERVFQLYRRAAEPSLPEARLWGIWSPRQIVDHVRSRRPSAALAELTDFVEEVYFSGRVPSETVLPNASEAVDRAIRERARV